jgi:CRP-like cAMP-binding protein
MALQDNVRNLALNPTLRDLEPDALRVIAFSAETRILRAGNVLFRRGEASDSGYVVLSGAIALQAEGGEETVVRAPTLIGESALITETTRAATATATEPSSVLKVSRALFHRVLDEFPDSAARLFQTLHVRLHGLTDELEALRVARLAPSP